MFRDARTLDRQRTAASFDHAFRRYAAESEKWFDGTVNSIDARLGLCDRLLHTCRATVARVAATDGHRYLRAAETLTADRHVLADLREDMLTGGANRMAADLAPAPAGGGDATVAGRPADAYSRTTGPAPGHAPPRPRHTPGGSATPSDGAITAHLNGTDRRWVTLESAKFVAAHPDALSDPHELSTRATHHAQLKTSTFTPERSASVTAAFVRRVAELGRQSYVPTTVRTAAVDISFDEAMLFL